MPGSDLRPAAVFAALLISACYSVRSPGPREPSEGSRASKTMTVEEIASVPGLTTLQLIEQLRPGWLRSRGQVSIESPEGAGVRVRVDDRPGILADLEMIPAANLAEVRFLDSREATTRFGTGYPDGVILISMKRSPQLPRDADDWILSKSEASVCHLGQYSM